MMQRAILSCAKRAMQGVKGMTPLAPSCYRRTFSAGAKTFATSKPDDILPGFREPGAVPTEFELATGAERYEYLKKLQNEEPWEDLQPILMKEPGTVANPTIVRGADPERYVGCSGFPSDSHEIVWLTLRPKQGHDRCPHCGNVFKYIREEQDNHNH